MHPIFQHDLVYTRIPIFTISIDLLLGNISGNYIFFGVPRPKGHPPRCFNARRKWISSASRVLPTAKPSNVAKAPRPRRAVGQNLRCSVQNLKYLDCSDLPNGKVKKDIEGKPSVFSSLPRLVDWKIYEPLFSDIQASSLHSGRTWTRAFAQKIRFTGPRSWKQGLGLFCCHKGRSSNLFR